MRSRRPDVPHLRRTGPAGDSCRGVGSSQLCRRPSSDARHAGVRFLGRSHSVTVEALSCHGSPFLKSKPEDPGRHRPPVPGGHPVPPRPAPRVSVSPNARRRLPGAPPPRLAEVASLRVTCGLPREGASAGALARGVRAGRGDWRGLCRERLPANLGLEWAPVGRETDGASGRGAGRLQSSLPLRLVGLRPVGGPRRGASRALLPRRRRRRPPADEVRHAGRQQTGVGPGVRSTLYVPLPHAPASLRLPSDAPSDNAEEEWGRSQRRLSV